MKNERKTPNPILKRVLIIIAILLSVGCIITIAIGYTIYVFFYGAPIWKIDKYDKEKFAQLYTLYLPEDYKFIKGHSSGFSPDLHDEYHFRVDIEDFEIMIGEKWEIKSDSNYTNFIEKEVAVEEQYYTIPIHASLYYKINGNKVDCYLTVYTKYEEQLKEN